jgi:hypothetical protein
MVVETATLAGIHLSYRIRLTLPPEAKFEVERCVFGRIHNTAYWSSARPKFWTRICASLPR